MARTYGLSRLSQLLSQSNLRRHSRRKFLKMATLAGGSTLATISLSQAQRTQAKTSPEVAIIGGGMAGLTAAYYLKQKGIEANLYEASSRIGGRIRTVQTPQGVREWGGEFVNSDHQDILYLVKEFGLNVINRKENPIFPNIPSVAYYFNHSFWTEAKLALALTSIAQQIQEDADLIENDPQWMTQLDSLSVSQYLSQHSDKIPDSSIRELLESVIRVEYGVEPFDSSALQLLFSLPTVNENQVEVLGSSDELYLIEGGSEELIRKLQQTLDPTKIWLNQPLKAIKRQGKQLVLTFKEFQKTVDYLILAIPNTALRQVKFNLSLSKSLQRFIEDVSLGTNQKVFASFESPLWQQEQGFSQEAWTDIGASEIWESSPQSLTFYLSAAEVFRSQRNYFLSDQMLLVQLDNYLAGLKEAFQGKFTRTQWHKEPFIQGTYTNFKPNQLTQFANCLYIESEQPNESQFIAEEQLIFAGEQFSSEYYGYMNGGAQTGRLASQYLLEHWQKSKIILSKNLP